MHSGYSSAPDADKVRHGLYVVESGGSTGAEAVAEDGQYLSEQSDVRVSTGHAEPNTSDTDRDQSSDFQKLQPDRATLGPGQLRSPQSELS